MFGLSVHCSILAAYLNYFRLTLVDAPIVFVDLIWLESVGYESPSIYSGLNVSDLLAITQ